jgi:hypothetical protein
MSLLSTEIAEKFNKDYCYQNDRELIWIELKLNLKTKNTNPSNLRSALFGDEVGEDKALL